MRAAAIAVVGIAKRQSTRPVQRQHARGLWLRAQRAHGQQQEEGRDDETVTARAQPGVPHMTEADVRPVASDRGDWKVHAASR